MKKTWIVLLLLYFTLAPCGASAHLIQDDLKIASKKVQNYLEHHHVSFKPEQVPPLTLEKKDNYLGYFHKKSFKISIDPDIDEIELQLTLTHEYVHAFRDLYNKNEENWLNEGIAKLFEYKYSHVWPVSYNERFKKTPYINLSDIHTDGVSKNFKINSDGYPSSFYFIYYLHNHFGGERLIYKLLRSPLSGWENLLESIKELKAQGHIDIDDKLLTKENILRHFAVSLWINDAYVAKYGLFHISEDFERISDFTNSPEFIFNPKIKGVQIAFSSEFKNIEASEVYSVLSREPFQIKKAEPEDKALVFIYIKH